MRAISICVLASISIRRAIGVAWGIGIVVIVAAISPWLRRGDRAPDAPAASPGPQPRPPRQVCRHCTVWSVGAPAFCSEATGAIGAAPAGKLSEVAPTAKATTPKNLEHSPIYDSPSFTVHAERRDVQRQTVNGLDGLVFRLVRPHPRARRRSPAQHTPWAAIACQLDLGRGSRRNSSSSACSSRRNLNASVAF